MKVTRDELKIHLEDACVQRKIRCMHCYNYLRVCDISIHINECPKMRLPCELKCGKIMCRTDVSLHLEDYCPEKEIPCPFAKYSCEVRIKRKHMSQHLEKKRTEHLELLLNGLNTPNCESKSTTISMISRSFRQNT